MGAAPGSYTTGQLDTWYMYSAKYKGPMHHINLSNHNLLQVHY